MSFILIAGGAGCRASVKRLERALKKRGNDVCVGVPIQHSEVFAPVARPLLDACSVAVLVGGDDPALTEFVRYAAMRGKLVTILLEQGADEEPAQRNPSRQVWSGAVRDVAQICEAIESAMRQAIDPQADPLAYTASEEFAAYARMRRRGGAEAMVQFLRAYPSGMLEDQVRSELDAATRPDYVPSRRARFAASVKDQDHPGKIWRLEGSAPMRMLRALQNRWAWIALPALALLAVVLLQRAPLGGVGNETQTAAIAPYPAEAALGDSVPAVQERESQGEEQARVEEAGPNRADIAFSEARDLQAAAQVLTPASVEALQDIPAMARGEGDRELAPAAAPVVWRTPVARVRYDASGLESSQRELVQRARAAEAGARREASARTDALHRLAGGAGAPLGSYRGQWSEGANGLGTGVWTDGSSYAGAWRGSRPHGYGVLVRADGLQYEGEFNAGAPTGQGVFWDAEGRPLRGDRLFSALLQARTP